MPTDSDAHSSRAAWAYTDIQRGNHTRSGRKNKIETATRPACLFKDTRASWVAKNAERKLAGKSEHISLEKVVGMATLTLAGWIGTADFRQWANNGQLAHVAATSFFLLPPFMLVTMTHEERLLHLKLNALWKLDTIITVKAKSLKSNSYIHLSSTDHAE